MRGTPAVAAVGAAACLSMGFGGAVAAAECPGFHAPVDQGVVIALEEASGLVASRNQPGILWAHNDSGDVPWIYALDSAGDLLASFLVEGVTNFDWEDIAIGPGPIPGTDYLYIADIGDNLRARSEIAIYRVIEPIVGAVVGAVVDPAVDTGSAHRPAVSAVSAAQLRVRYPGGAADAETLLADPETGDLYIVTKVFLGPSGIYAYPAPHDEVGLQDLTPLGSLVPPTGTALITGGDVSPLGDEVLIRTYTHALLYPRLGGDSIVDALQGSACEVPVADEFQGEAIAFSADASGHFTTSEQAGQGPQPLYRTARAAAPCTLDLSATYSTNPEGQMETIFQLGTTTPAFWGFWLIWGGSSFQLWGLPLPVVDPPVTLSLAFPFPGLGLVGLVGAVVAESGATCVDAEVVDTTPSLTRNP